MKKIKLFSVLLILGMILGLSACGKASLPEPYEGSGYPHSYPRN